MDHIENSVEVWITDNYALMGGDFENQTFHRSFSTSEEAISYIKIQLDEELKEWATEMEDYDALIGQYKRFGSDYFLKNSTEFFSSWKYVEENARRIWDETKTELKND